MAQYMAEQPHIEQRVRQGGTVHAEQIGGGPAVGDPCQDQGGQRKEKEGKGHRGVILETDGTSLHKRASFINREYMMVFIIPHPGRIAKRRHGEAVCKIHEKSSFSG